jgi:hypothetical protein
MSHIAYYNEENIVKQNKDEKSIWWGFPRRVNVNSCGEKSGGTEEEPHKSHNSIFNVLTLVLFKF